MGIEQTRLNNLYTDFIFGVSIADEIKNNYKKGNKLDVDLFIRDLSSLINKSYETKIGIGSLHLQSIKALPIPSEQQFIIYRLGLQILLGTSKIDSSIAKEIVEYVSKVFNGNPDEQAIKLVEQIDSWNMQTRRLIFNLGFSLSRNPFNIPMKNFLDFFMKIEAEDQEDIVQFLRRILPQERTHIFGLAFPILQNIDGEDVRKFWRCSHFRPISPMQSVFFAIHLTV